jgi:cytochrome c-type biogenesis protein CcmF
MIHPFVGNLGHFLVITAFVSVFISAYSYWKAQRSDELSKPGWTKFGRIAFYVHGVSVVGVVVALFLIINRHYFEYHYAWSHSSSELPIYYQLSTFWNGQEGSFLLWIFWHVILGAILIKTNKFWEPSIMSVFSAVQGFLLSMILGVVIFNVKIGSSPFILLREAMNAPIFQLNPDFVPEDGSGLNPLLQNYWMVIHPPTLFLGFATTIVPFCYCIAGLWIGKYKEWIRPALPWALFSGAVLGVGILMGAYWAYETLNFGGYWNWDPVENAVYVPWLVLVGAIHTMITFKKSNTALKAAAVLTVATFILILYQTFLTRSGILGDGSVHSFTDLGLSGQLLIYLATFTVLSIWLLAKRWKEIPTTDEEVSTYSREFWIFMGVTTLCLMGFQVIIPTSIPVWNAIVELFGGISNIAPPADQVAFYSKWQIWLAVVLALLSGTGQFFWWKKIDKKKLRESLFYPVVLSLLISGVVIVVARITEAAYILLLTSGIYSIVANGKILFSLLKTSPKLAGGAVAHIGIAMMLVGVLFSSGYSKIISLNKTGMIWHKDFPEEMNTNNLLLFQHEAMQMGDYSLNYKGIRKEIEGFPGYVSTSAIEAFGDKYKVVARKDIEWNGKKYFSEGDTLEIDNPENSFFEIEYSKDNGQTFKLYPRVQINESMGMVYSPDIKRTVTSDLYTHVRTFPDPEAETQWGEMEEVTVKVGETFFVNDYVARVQGIERISEIPQVTLGPEDVAIKARVVISGSDEDYVVEPIYLIKDRMIGLIPEEVKDVAAKITFLNVHPESNSFTFGINTTQKEWVILEAVVKPYINILWTGTFIMVLGFGMAIRRRYDEFIKMRDKGQE